MALTGKRQTAGHIQKRVSSFKDHLSTGLIVPGMLGKKQSEHQKRRAKEANLENKHGYGIIFTEERRRKISEKLKGNRNYKYRKGGPDSRPDMIGNQFNKGRVAWNKGLTKVDPRIARIAEGVSKAKTGRSLSEEHKAKIRAACQSDEYRRRHSIITSRAIRKPKTEEHKRNVLKVVCARPNSFEARCLGYLEVMYPNRFLYTGDGSFIVNGRSADAFDKTNGIVALFNGTYFHLKRHGRKISRANKRKVEVVEAEPFRRAGYNVILIWEDELDSIINMTNRADEVKEAANQKLRMQKEWCDAKWIKREYLEKKRSFRELGLELKWHKNKVKKYLEILNIPLRSHKEQVTLALARIKSLRSLRGVSKRDGIYKKVYIN